MSSLPIDADTSTKLPPLESLGLSADVIPEPTSQENHIVLWWPAGQTDKFEHWVRISNVPGGPTALRDGLCAAAAQVISVRYAAGALAFIDRHREFLPDAGQDLKAWVCQEWIAAAYAQGGEEAARTLIRQLQKENGQDRSFREVVRSHVVRTLNHALENAKEAKDYKAALSFIERHCDLLRDEAAANTLSLPVYDAWAKPFMKPGKWAEAIKVYQDALAVYPNDSHLTQNLKYCEQESKKQEK